MGTASILDLKFGTWKWLEQRKCNHIFIIFYNIFPIELWFRGIRYTPFWDKPVYIIVCHWDVVIKENTKHTSASTHLSMSPHSILSKRTFDISSSWPNSRLTTKAQETSFPKARCVFKLSWVDTGGMVRSIYDPDFVPSFGAQRISHTIQHFSRSVVVSIGTSDTGIQANVQTKNSNQVLSKYDQMSQVVWLFVEWNKNQQAQLYTSYIYILSNIPLHTYIYIYIKLFRYWWNRAESDQLQPIAGLGYLGCLCLVPVSSVGHRK